MRSLLALACLAAGCVPNSSLSIVGLVPDDPMSSCVVPATVAITQSRWLLDVGIVSASGAPGYTAAMVVKNDLPANMNTTTDVERHNITLNKFNVQLNPDATLAGAIPTNQRKFSVQVGSQQIAPMGTLGVLVEVIPRPIALELAGSVPTGVGNAFPVVNANVSPVGDFGGDTEVGPSTTIPIQICKFCLSGQPANCPANGFKATDVLVGGCFEAQDVPVTCCVNAQQQLLCGSQVPLVTM